MREEELIAVATLWLRSLTYSVASAADPMQAVSEDVQTMRLIEEPLINMFLLDITFQFLNTEYKLLLMQRHNTQDIFC